MGSAIIKSVFAFEISQTDNRQNIIADFIKDLFVQSYVLWVFGFLLIAFIWTGRIWRKWMKMGIKEQRQYDSIFVYEFGMLLTIVIVLFWIFDFKLGDEISGALKIILIVLIVFAALHFLYLLLAVGIREKLPIKRLIAISVICTYLFVFVAFGAEIITIPILLLPILVIFSPVYYLAKNVYKGLRLSLR